MEMCLKTMQSCLLNVSIEQSDSRSLHNIILRISFHDNLELLARFFVFHLGSDVNRLVVHREIVIFVILENFCGRVEIYWSLFITE